ncbi:hypothetical protein [Brevibacillus fluminis]|nr:hypothetical protein [Brevibacillus fluminis]
MNLVLTEKQCKSCQVRLTEYEIENNRGFCIDCFKEDKTGESEAKQNS